MLNYVVSLDDPSHSFYGPVVVGFITDLIKLFMPFLYPSQMPKINFIFTYYF